MNKEEYFISVQEIERDLINKLFQNYFKERECRDLETTPLTGYSKHDGSFTSGNSQIIFEFKRRNIPSLKYNDTFIEANKFIELYQHYLQGYYSLFIIEYDDHYFLFDLQYEFYLFRPYVNSQYCFFSLLNASKNQFHSNEKEDKLVRYLPYHQATVILDKAFKELTYNQYLQYRLSSVTTVLA